MKAIRSKSEAVLSVSIVQVGIEDSHLLQLIHDVAQGQVASHHLPIRLCYRVPEWWAVVTVHGNEATLLLQADMRTTMLACLSQQQVSDDAGLVKTWL